MATLAFIFCALCYGCSFIAVLDGVSREGQRGAERQTGFGIAGMLVFGIALGSLLDMML